MSLLIQAASYVGDFTPGKTVRFFFNATDATGVLTAITGPVVSIYKDGNTAESVAGVTLTQGFDSRTGLYQVVVDTSADGTFYSAGSEFEAVLTTGAIGVVSVIGTTCGHFSLSNRSGLRPTVADRTLDVTTTGEAGVDWANVGGQNASVDLNGTSIAAVDTVATTSQIGANGIGLGSIAATELSAIGAATRDVSNLAPAANSLGAMVSTGGVAAADSRFTS